MSNVLKASIIQSRIYFQEIIHSASKDFQFATTKPRFTNPELRNHD